MIKSLYVRVVITFIATVMLSLILAFYLATLLYKNQITSLAEKQLIISGKQIIQSYQQSQTDNVESLPQGAGLLLNYRVQIYNDKGEAMFTQSVKNQKLIMNKDQIEFVLNGGV
jgi:uncharacterized membrane protein